MMPFEQRLKRQAKNIEKHLRIAWATTGLEKEKHQKKALALREKYINKAIELDKEYEVKNK